MKTSRRPSPTRPAFFLTALAVAAGVRWPATEAVDVFSSFSFDNSNDKLVRFGMSVKF